MTTPLIPTQGIPDAATEARVRQNTEAIMRAKQISREQATAMALQYEGMNPATTAPPKPSMAMDAGKKARSLSELTPELYLHSLTGMLATAARGITLGATDNIPAMKDAAAQYRADNGRFAGAVELGAGMALNPLGKVVGVIAKGAKAVPVVGRIMQGLNAAANPTGAKTAMQAFKQGLKSGGFYGAAYGFNTATEGTTGERVANAAATGTMGALTGGLLGTTIHVAAPRIERMARSLKGAPRPPSPETLDWHPSPEALELLEHGFTLDRGSLPTTADLKPGYVLADLLGANGRQTFQEAVRSSPKSVAVADAFRNSRYGASSDEIMNAVHTVVRGRPVSGPRFNPEAESRALVRQASDDAAPIYREIQAANPEIPDSPMMQAIFKSPTIRQTARSKEFKMFVGDRAAADKVREMMGQTARGEVAIPTTGKSPVVVAMEAQLGRPLTPEQIARMEQSGVLPPTKRITWRDLDNLKKKIDTHFGGQTSDQLRNAANDDLMALRAGMIQEMDAAAPQYAQARQVYADPMTASEMMKRGAAAERAGADVVEADLMDPKLTILGAAALEHYKLGVMGNIQSVAGKRSIEASPVGFWTPDMLRIVQAIKTPGGPDPAELATIMTTRHETASFVPTRTSEGLTGRGERLRGAGAAGLTAVAAGEPWMAVRQVVSEASRRGRKMPDLQSQELTAILLHREPARVLEWLHAQRMGFEAGKMAGQLAGRQTGRGMAPYPNTP
jgi:hypothetical protein